MVLLQLLGCVGVHWEEKTLKSWGGFPRDGLEAWVRQRATRQGDPSPSRVSPVRCAVGRIGLAPRPETINLVWKPCMEGWSPLDAIQKKQQVSHSFVQQTLTECLLYISTLNTRDTALKSLPSWCLCEAFTSFSPHTRWNCFLGSLLISFLNCSSASRATEKLTLHFWLFKSVH